MLRSCFLSRFVEFCSAVSEKKSKMSQPTRGQGCHLVFPIGPKNNNSVEDVEILLPVKLRWILFSRFRGEVENVSANQRPGRSSCFSDRPEKHKLGRGCWDLASCQVSLNSVQPFPTKLDRKQDLNILYRVIVFWADRKNKMAALASGWLRHFRLLLWNSWTEFNKTWQEARSQHPLLSLCFSGRSEKQDGHSGLWLDESFSTSPLKPLNRIQRNLTGSKISTSSTKFVFFGPIGKTRWPPWSLIGWDIFNFSSETAEQNSTKLDRKQDVNVLYQVCVFFWADRKNKMAALASDWLRHFRLLLWNGWTELEEISRMSQQIRGQGGHLVFPIGLKNTNVVEGVETLLPVKFRRILFRGFFREVENVSANQGRGRPFCFSDRPEKHKLGRGRWDLASYQVLSNSVQRFQRRSRKCLSQSEARAAISFFLMELKNSNLVEGIKILLPVKFHWILFRGFFREVENVSANQRRGRPFCFSDRPEKHKLGRGRWDLASYQVLSNSVQRFPTKLDRQQDLNAFYHVCVFRADLKNKMAAPASDWLRHFRLLWGKKPLNGIQWNLTGSKILIPSTKFVFFSSIGKNKMAALASNWLRHFGLLLWNCTMEFDETW